MALAGEAGGSGPLAVFKQEGMRGKEEQSYQALLQQMVTTGGCLHAVRGGWAEPLQGGSSFCGREGNGAGDGVMVLQAQMLASDSTAGDGVNSLLAGGVQGPSPYHDAGEQAHAFPAVGVRHHVSVADGEEGDGDKPHGPQEVAGHFLFIVVPGENGEGWSAHRVLPPSSHPRGSALTTGS